MKWSIKLIKLELLRRKLGRMINGRLNLNKRFATDRKIKKWSKRQFKVFQKQEDLENKNI